MKSIMTITGDLGSGKSTVAKKICELTGMSYFSTGTIQRQIAAERGIDTLQLNKDCKNDKSVDDLIDNRLRAMNTDGTDNIIIDSRLAWFFVNSAFKIYLTCSPEVAAQRVSLDKVRTNEPGGSKEEILNHLLERQKEENERFKLFYGADCHNLNNFDIVVDSSHSTPDEVADTILKAFAEYKKGSGK